MSSEDRELLMRRGWDPIDVRLLPNSSDGDRAKSVKAWLEGMRLDTIECSSVVAKYVEIEARIYGLTSGKAPDQETKKTGYDDLSFEDLLEIGGPTGHQNDDKQLTAGKKRGGGRKKGSSDSYSRGTPDRDYTKK